MIEPAFAGIITETYGTKKSIHQLNHFSSKGKCLFEFNSFNFPIF